MFGRTKVDKEKEKRLSDLRSHISKMDSGKRILLTDGRIGVFKGFDGGIF